MISAEAQKIIKDSPKFVLLAGAVGAMGPHIAELVSILKVPYEQLDLPHWNYYLVMIIYAVMGCAVVLFGKEKTMWKGFMQGFGAPALISSGGTVAVAAAPVVETVMIVFMTMFSPNIAYAQDDVGIVSDSIVVKFDVMAKVNVVLGENVYRIHDNVVVKKISEKDRVIIEHGTEERKIELPKADSATVKIRVIHQKGKHWSARGFFPMMQRKGAPPPIKLDIKVSK